MRELGDVVVVAPDRDQSGVGTARTLLQALRVTEVESRIEGVPARSVQGTPADCVILATEELFPEPFDLLVSGINPGANLGLDVLDSGTVGGAFRGFFRGIPSIAVSVTSLTNVRYDLAARVTAELAKAIFDHTLSKPGRAGGAYDTGTQSLPGERGARQRRSSGPLLDLSQQAHRRPRRGGHGHLGGAPQPDIHNSDGSVLHIWTRRL